MDEPRAKQEVEKQGQPDALVLQQLGLGRSPSRGLRQRVSGVPLRSVSAAHFDNVTAAGWLIEHKRQAEVREKARPHELTLAEVVAATAGRVPETFLVRHTVGQAGGRRG